MNVNVNVNVHDNSLICTITLVQRVTRFLFRACEAQTMRANRGYSLRHEYVMGTYEKFFTRVRTDVGIPEGIPICYWSRLPAPALAP